MFCIAGALPQKVTSATTASPSATQTGHKVDDLDFEAFVFIFN
jgi:hypothetical protein